MFLALSVLPNIIKIQAYRLLFAARIGRDVKIGFAAVLIFDKLEMGDHCRVGPLCLIRVRHLTIGARTMIGAFNRVTVHTMNLGPSVTIGPQVSILASDRDPRCEFTAGAETWVFEYCYINPARPIRLGRNVGVGGGSYIFAHGLWLSKLKGYPVAFGEVTIGDDVWLPWGCFIMPGVNIGDGSVVGARSVVTKNVPPRALVAGSPAKVIRESVAQEPSLEAKVQILQDVTREFCDLNEIILECEQRGDWCIFKMNGREEVAVATHTVFDSYIRSERVSPLHVVPGLLRDFAEETLPAFSLTSFQCTPRATFTDLQASWLRHLRQIGARHYPIDEVNVEEAQA